MDGCSSPKLTHHPAASQSDLSLKREGNSQQPFWYILLIGKGKFLKMNMCMEGCSSLLYIVERGGHALAWTG